MSIALKLLRKFPGVSTVFDQRDRSRAQLRDLGKELDGLRASEEGLQGQVTELQKKLASSLVPGTEEFDLAAAERQRDRMRGIQPYIPNSTAGVFSYSQHQQELFVLEHHNFKRDGFFLEVGVANGREYSNTYLLEKHFGWKGILCEPNPLYIESIRNNRTAILDIRAAYSKTGETVRFLCVPGEYGTLSTISEFISSDFHTRDGAEVEVETVSLEDLLVQHGAPSKIDYLSLDTEGSENLIIGNFDFKRWDIAVLTIEHNLVPGRVEQFDEILLPYNYRRVLSEVSSVDGWYIKR